MKQFRYSLQKKGKSICPECGRKTFVLYFDNQEDKVVYSTVGKCDRLDKCGYHYTPKQYFSDNNFSFDNQINLTAKSKFVSKPQPSYIDIELVKQSLCKYKNNRLVQYLYKIVGHEATHTAINRYFLGTSKHWEGATVFWQIDRNGKAHTGKIMQYDSQTGKRIKTPYNKALQGYPF